MWKWEPNEQLSVADRLVRCICNNVSASMQAVARLVKMPSYII